MRAERQVCQTKLPGKSLLFICLEVSALQIIRNFIIPSGYLETDIYENLFQDARWITKRSEIFARDGGVCVICKSSESLVVHFRQYHFSRMLRRLVLPWKYENSYLVTLCQKCHEKGHKNYKIPIKEVY